MLRTNGRGAWVDVEIVVVAALGVAVRMRQFASGRSLWLDEASVANDLAELSVVEALTQRSPRNQMAPPGFSIISHAADAISSDEMMLRLFPLLSGVALIVVAVIYAMRQIEMRPARFLLVALIALSPSLIHYSAELKQYGVEALLAMVTLLAVAERERLGRLGVVLLAGVMLAFSIPALLIVPALGGLWLVSEARRRGLGEAVRYLAAPGAVIVIGWAAAFTWAQLVKPGIMQGFWEDAFAPLPTGVDQVGWWVRTTVGVSHLTLSNVGVPLHTEDPSWVALGTRLVALALWGLVAAGAWQAAASVRQRRHRKVVHSPAMANWLAVVPVAATITAGFALAAILELYPFRGRLILVLVPLVAAAAAHGFDVVLERQPSRAFERLATALTGIAAVVVTVVVAWSAVGLLIDPYDRWDIEPAIEWIADNANEGDAVVPYFLSYPQTQYYQSHLDTAGLVAEPYFGALETATVLGEIGPRRAWFLHGHIRNDRELVEALAAHPSVVATFRAESVIALLFDPGSG